jgi:hypothetical protein
MNNLGRVIPTCAAKVLVRKAGRLAMAWLLVAGVCSMEVPRLRAAELQRVPFNNPGLVVDLGVGLWAWPVPLDLRGDGKRDLMVVCPDTPYNGTYYFENVGTDPKSPLFKPGVRIGRGISNVTPSYADGRLRVLAPSCAYPDFAHSGVENPAKLNLPANVHPEKVRTNQWQYLDYDGDGKTDLIIAVEDWSDYGWDNAFDPNGQWTHGPLHGYIYLLRNRGTNDEPQYQSPVKLEAGGQPIDVFGRPSPCFADFRSTGKLDLICGSFLDGFTWFENIGTRTQPCYAAGRPLANQGEPLRMDLEMIVPVAVDWDGDGHVDLIVGQEDGRVALLENTGKVADGMPQFLPPRFFQQQAADVKFGVLVTPVGFDWDGDGHEDILCGNSAGYLGFIKNLGGTPLKWAAPQELQVDGRVIRIMAGPNGSIQGPAEGKWGYTTLSVADWDRDGLPDLIVNSIWGKVIWYRNVGTRTQPKLAAAQPIEVDWPGPSPKPAWNWWNPAGKELATQWRTTPVVFDLNGDGLKDLVMLDHEGFLVFFERTRRGNQLSLLPGKRVLIGENGSVFDSNHRCLSKAAGPLRLNEGVAGKSGRRKLCLADWDGDGKPDLLVNSRNVNFLKNVSTKPGEILFRDMGPLDSLGLAGHDTSPTVVHWDEDGIADLLVGAEDGHLYFKRNPRHAERKGEKP